jgi:PhnB protein
VPNVDEVVARAVAAGATLREPTATFVSGDRYASLLDPFGVRWAIMTRVEDLAPEESHRRIEEWSRKQAGQ